jgi:hypothetical protein
VKNRKRIVQRLGDRSIFRVLKILKKVLDLIISSVKIKFSIYAQNAPFPLMERFSIFDTKIPSKAGFHPFPGQ